MHLSFDQQKRQDIILPFYLICFAYLSSMRMHQLISGSGDFWPIIEPVIVETDYASGNKMRPDDMEIIFYVSLPVAAIDESKDESLFLREANFSGICPSSYDVIKTSN